MVPLADYKDTYMKTVLFLLAAVLSATAQTKPDWEVFSTLQGDFTNATVIRTNPAYLVVSHQNGISKVAFTNLSPELQNRYGYDPAKAAAALENEKAHARLVAAQRIEYENALAKLRGPQEQIIVKALLDDFGQCDTSVGKIYLLGVPASVASYYAQHASLQAALAQAQGMPNTATVSGTFRNLRAEKNALHRSEASAQKQNTAAITQLQNQLTALEKTQTKATTVNAYSTGLKDNGIPRWQVVAGN